MNEKTNPVPVEEQAPSDRARKQIDERVHEFRAGVHKATAGLSDYDQGDEVEVKESARYGSVTEGAERDALGRKGRVVGQAYVGAEGTQHAGKVCRGVMLENGELITTSEEKLRSYSRTAVSFSHVSQERWDAIFNKKKRRKK